MSGYSLPSMIELAAARQVRELQGLIELSIEDHYAFAAWLLTAEANGFDDDSVRGALVEAVLEAGREPSIRRGMRRLARAVREAWAGATPEAQSSPVHAPLLDRLKATASPQEALELLAGLDERLLLVAIGRVLAIRQDAQRGRR